MMELSRTWTGYFLSGALAVVLSWAMTGCRFGNKVERSETAVDDGFTGYYQTRPQSLRFCVTDETDTQCASAQTNLVPPTVSNVVSNPVALLLEEGGGGNALLFDPYGNGSALPVFVDTATGALSYIGYTAEEILWEDAACTTTLYVEEEGQSVQDFLGDILGLPVRGRISLNVSIFSTYDGDCTADLNVISDCYQDSKDCGGADDEENSMLQLVVQQVFSPYIDAGVLTPGTIPEILSLGYEVSYE